MHRLRHRLRSSALLSLSLLSVLALLAGAILPALAQAEDSSGIQYEVEHYESGAKPKKHPGAEEQASASHQAHPKTGTSESTHESEESEGSKHGAATGNGGEGGGGSNGGKASKANPPGGGGQASEGLGGEKEVGGTAQGQNASHSSGGSSPLVPILIAIALLAAISIGAVIYRQRRQGGGGSGSPVSPKAG